MVQKMVMQVMLADCLLILAAGPGRAAEPEVRCAVAPDGALGRELAARKRPHWGA